MPRKIILEEIVTKTDIESTYQREHVAEETLRTLEEAGIFQLTLANPKLLFLNTLGLYVYLSGNLDYYQLSYHARISNPSKLHLPLDEWKDQLSLSFGETSGALTLRENGAVYARLLSLMGFHTSFAEGEGRTTKAKTGSGLPPYLVKCIQNYPNQTRSIKRHTGRLIRDFISVWFDTKGVLDSGGGGGISVNLLSQPSELQVYEQAGLFAGAINILYPEINLTHEAINVGQNKELNTYSGHIRFTIDQLVKFPSNGAVPIKFQISIRPRYSFQRTPWMYPAKRCK